MTTGLAFIGGGNMTTALVDGLRAATERDVQIAISDPDDDRRAALRKRFPDCQIDPSNALIASQADIIVLSVKPQYILAVAAELGQAIDVADKTFVSVAAGTSIDSLQLKLGASAWVIRCMPNQPALVGFGMTALYASANVPLSAREASESIMQACGATTWVADESMIDAATAVSGSGPAYFYEFMAALIDEAKRLGFDDEQARMLVTETALGAAMVARTSGDSLEDLRIRVTSPGGTTEAALESLANDDLRTIVGRAASAAYTRSQELANLSKE